MRLLKSVLYFSLAFFCSFSSIAQTSQIGIVPVYNFRSENVLFVDADKGELISFSVLPEPVFSVAVNEEENIFYAQTRHYIVKASLKSGEIIDKFQYMEFLEQHKEEATDPNGMIFPYGVTKDGKALYAHNKEQREIQKKQYELTAQMKAASGNEITELSLKIAELGKKTIPLLKITELYKADFKTKEVEPFKKVHLDEEQVLSINQDGLVKIFDKQNSKLTNLNIDSKKEVSSQSIAPVYELAPTLAKYKNLTTPMEVSENLVGLTVYIGQGGGLLVLYNSETEEVVSTKEFNSALDSQYPLFYKNTETYYIGDKSCSVGPMPQIKMPEMDGTSKKALAEYKENLAKAQSEFQQKMDEWKKKATNPANCSIKIFDDKELENQVYEIPNASMATVYNNNFALVRRNFELAMYDLEAGKQLWAIDTNF